MNREVFEAKENVDGSAGNLDLGLHCLLHHRVQPWHLVQIAKSRTFIYYDFFVAIANLKLHAVLKCFKVLLARNCLQV